MTNGAESVRWDLSPLYGSPDDPALLADLASALEDAKAFAAQYHGQVGALGAPGLAAMIEALEQINERIERVGTFAYLHFVTDTADPTRGALLQTVEERSTAIATELLFVELEWAAVPDARAAELLADTALDRWRHYFASARRFRPHLLSEPEEKVVAEKAVTGRAAWSRLFTQVTDAITVDLDGEPVPLEHALSRLHHPDLEKRHAAGQAVTAALAPGLAVRTYIYNTVLADHSIDDRLRAFPTWISARNLGNEVDESTVEALVSSVTSRYDLPARWYRLKAHLLGLDELTEHDRYAPLLPDEREVDWPEACRTVLDAYRSFSPRMADIAAGFFDRYIDAPVVAGKQGGAFSHPAVPSAHPYVLVNFTGRRHDVMTLAHELGHGVHQVLANDQGLFNAATPLTLAETASIFGETVTFARLLDDERVPQARLALLAHRIEDICASVFRQTAMNRFEDSVHNLRRAEGELSTERFGEEWLRTQREMFGDSVRISDEYATWWSYIPHFIHTPGYVYAYAFGNLLALAIYARYEAEGAAFVPSYLELLSAGGSDRPEVLAALVGVDLTDPGFWSSGLAVIGELVDEAEKLADSVDSSR
jgi:oligoendopeptidase F